MTKEKNAARLAWWQYRKRLQTLREALGHLTHTGFIFLKFTNHAKQCKKTYPKTN
jgi:hypothetical protein